MRTVKVGRSFCRLTIIVLLALLGSACASSTVVAYARAKYGPFRIEVRIDDHGQISIGSSFQKEFAFSLGPIELEAGIRDTVTLTTSQPQTLFILWRDETGIVRRDSYQIGKSFRIVFEDGTRIREIQGTNDSIVVVVEDENSSNCPYRVGSDEINVGNDSGACATISSSTFLNIISTSSSVYDAIAQLDRTFESNPQTGYQYRQIIPARVPPAASRQRVLWGSLDWIDSSTNLRIHRIWCNYSNPCIYVILDNSEFMVGYAGRGILLDAPLSDALLRQITH